MKPLKYPIFRSILAATLLLAACNPTPVTQDKPTTPSVQPETPSSAKPETPSSAKPETLRGTSVDLLQGRQGVAGQILDAKTGTLVTAATEIRVAGPDAGKVEQTSLKTSNGTFGLVLKSGVKPSASAPLHLTLVAEADGYFTGSSQVNLTDSLEAFSMTLTNISAPPNGVGTASNNQGLAGADGKLTTGITLQAQAGDALASFELDANTVVTDANGQPLNGPLQTQVGYFSNTTDEALNAFPGGFAPNTVSSNGQDEQGYFVTGGFVSVDITDGSGKKAANFSQPAEVTVQIPNGTINPDTKQPVKVGDKIGIWSHSTSTGQWSLEGEGTVKAGSNGNFDVTYTASHLSYWNLDWFYSATCNPKLLLNWDSDNHIPVTMKVLMDDENWYTHSNQLQDAENELYNVPLDRELTFVGSFGKKEVGRTVVTLDQSCQPITVNINTQNLPELRKLPVKVTLSSQTEFTKREIEYLGERLGVSQEVMAKVSAYTHPDSPSKRFKFDEKAYLEIEKLGFNQIQALKLMLAQVYLPSTYLSYYVANEHNNYGYTELTNGMGEVSVFEKTRYEFYTYVYYNNQYYYLSQKATVQPGAAEIRLDFKNLELTLEVIQEFLDKLDPSLKEDLASGNVG